MSNRGESLLLPEVGGTAVTDNLMGHDADELCDIGSRQHRPEVMTSFDCIVYAAGSRGFGFESGSRHAKSNTRVELLFPPEFRGQDEMDPVVSTSALHDKKAQNFATWMR